MRITLAPFSQRLDGGCDTRATASDNDDIGRGIDILSRCFGESLVLQNRGLSGQSSAAF